MKKILIMSPYPESLAAGQRLKYEQYFKSWEAKGYELQKSSFFSISTWDVLWSKGHLLRKITGTIQGYFRRINDLYRLQGCDVVYIFMWATPLGLPFYEWLILKSGKKIIYDFDDAVFSSSDYLSLIKGGYKSRFLIKHSHQIILSSPFLLDHCMESNKHSKVKYIPCSLDLNRFELKNSKWPKKIVLGWTGTFSSKHYLDSIRDVFYEVNKYLDIKIILITNFDYSLEGLDCEVIRWKESSEISDLHKIDIGLYPLIQTDWALGKGGLKALQYMAAGIPAIATNYGTVKDFIIHEKNGLLVDSKDQWVDAIKTVAENPKLRNNIIINARNTVKINYSVSSNEKKYLAIFEKLTKGLN
jgi:glycosyltransferase involved in cell wall biosynthesis